MTFSPRESTIFRSRTTCRTSPKQLTDLRSPGSANVLLISLTNTSWRATPTPTAWRRCTESRLPSSARDRRGSPQLGCADGRPSAKSSMAGRCGERQRAPKIIENSRQSARDSPMVHMTLPELDEVRIGLIGLGYVGLPLAAYLARKFPVLGFDIDGRRVDELQKGYDRTNEVTAEEMRLARGLRFSSNQSELGGCNFYIVTVPTPIDFCCVRFDCAPGGQRDGGSRNFKR